MFRIITYCTTFQNVLIKSPFTLREDYLIRGLTSMYISVGFNEQLKLISPIFVNYGIWWYEECISRWCLDKLQLACHFVKHFKPPYLGVCIIII